MVHKLRWENLRLYVELKGDSFNTANSYEISQKGFVESR